MSRSATHPTILGTGSFVPERVVTNAELSRSLGEEIDEFVSGTLGIRERRWCGPDESVADLAEPAARRAMEAAGVGPDEIDLLVVSTDTPEYISPPTASVLHGRLGLPYTTGTFDVNAACTGFVTALDLAAKYLVAEPRLNRILVVAAYAMTKFVDPTDKKTVTIFADGAGAVVVGRSPEPGILASEFRADGSLSDGLGVFAGGTAEPITPEVLAEGYRNRLHFVKKYPPEVNLEGWPAIVREVLGRIDRTVPEVDHWLWTQVNLSTIREVMRVLDEPMEKAPTIMDKWGYTGSACLPMALDDAVRSERIRPGELLVLTGSGAGLAMGSLAMIWNLREAP
ncbi:MAG: ketoacyl-ACP synthase III [Gemmatimonadales bacterium]|nr:MAG: ketoacyl-ACP synthase III [Gemmatimonadales bacterium]